MNTKVMKTAGLAPKDFIMQLALVQEFFWKELNVDKADDFKVCVWSGVDPCGRP